MVPGYLSSSSRNTGADVTFPGLHSPSSMFTFFIHELITNCTMSLRLPIVQFRSPIYRTSLSSSCNRFAQPPNYHSSISSASNRLAQFSHAAVVREEKAEDPRLKEEFGDLVIEDQYAILREKYGMLQPSRYNDFLLLTNHKDTPKNPIILAHGLMGFEGKRYSTDDVLMFKK
jgi:hypothetical protein